jgi:acetyl-CoA synthetase
MHDVKRFSAKGELAVLREHHVTSLCAPPTVWRLMVLEDLGPRPDALTDVASAGEPLNPEVMSTVEKAWGLTLRDGFGQTETTAQVGNPPGQRVVPGSMGRALPGYDVVLVDAEGKVSDEGEIALRLTPRPLGLMVGYEDDPEKTAAVMAGGLYRTGDEAKQDADGYITYVGRGDDVFKSSDYRLSPFELESALLEHPAVAEAAVVPSPDPVRLFVPKAFIVLKPGQSADAATARSLFAFCKEKLAPFKRIRRISFAELPKTISGKIRRVQLRRDEAARRQASARDEQEFLYEDSQREG